MVQHLTKHAFLVATLTATAGLAFADGNAHHATESHNVPVTELSYADIGFPPLLAAAGQGEMLRGPHSTFVKLPAGFVSPVHIHSDDYWAVVVSGVIANGPPNADDVSLPPGSFWFQAGKENHVTKCLSADECILFVSQGAKFDFILR